MSESPAIGPPPGISARDWAIHEANVQQFGPLPLPDHFKDSKLLRRRVAVYPGGTFPIKQDEPKR